MSFPCHVGYRSSMCCAAVSPSKFLEVRVNHCPVLDARVHKLYQARCNRHIARRKKRVKRTKARGRKNRSRTWSAKFSAFSPEFRCCLCVCFVHSFTRKRERAYKVDAPFRRLCPLVCSGICFKDATVETIGWINRNIQYISLSLSLYIYVYMIYMIYCTIQKDKEIFIKQKINKINK